MEKMRDDGKPVLVTELGLSTRVTHLLQRNGIHSVAILERMGDESLMLLRGMGPGMFAEIRSKVPRPKVSDAEELAAYRATGLTTQEIKALADVVRCRECVHWKPTGSRAGNSFSDMEYIGGCEFTKYCRRESDFCSYGERKEGAD